MHKKRLHQLQHLIILQCSNQAQEAQMADKIIKVQDAATKAKPVPVAAATAAVDRVTVDVAPAAMPATERALASAPVAKAAAPAKPVAKAATPKVVDPKAAEPKPAEPAVKKPVAVAAPVAIAAPAPAEKPVPVKTTITEKTNPKPIAAPAATAIPVKKESTMETTIKNTTDKAQTMFVEMNDRAKAALEKTQGMFADMTEFNKGNVEALVESSKIAAKGIETMGQDAAEYTRKSFEGMTAIVKSLSSVKSPTEFMKLHSDYVRTSFDSMVAESSKTTETMLKLAGEIAQPISNRVAIAAEKIKISA
jgi:phasin family protein